MRKGEEGGFNLKKFTLATLTGAAVAIVLCLVMLLAVSGLILSGALGEGSAMVAMLVLLFITSAIGGYVAAKKNGSRYLITGAVAGLLVFLIICLVGLLFYDNFLPSHGGVQIFIAAIVGAMAGAMLNNRKKSRKRK